MNIAIPQATPKTALITGQDPHIDKALNGQRFKLHYRDLSDSSNLNRIIQETQPDEIYNLGAQSHVAVRFKGYPMNEEQGSGLAIKHRSFTIP